MCEKEKEQTAPETETVDQEDTAPPEETVTEETPAAVGVQTDEDLAPGEVWLSVAEGAGIRLKPDGTIALTGTVTVNGREV
ncbi:MAG: hypothetical protein J6K94_08095 [Ruminiclostridium sp.]|nr:hypothetical protein [Ruminiclostridium sp.]